MKVKVTMISRTTDPLFTMAFAAKLCYFKGKDAMTLHQELKENVAEQERIVRHCIEHRHLSVLEHCSFTFLIEGVSRNFTHQLVRHRNTSYEQQSLHYIKASEDFDIAMPTECDDNLKGVMNDAKNYAFCTYKDLMDAGMAKEDARHVLPSGIETKIVMTANLRQYMHFIRLRMCKVNCEEIILVANEVRKQLVDILPVMYMYLGPNCWVHGMCIEGSRFCGAPSKLPLALKDGSNVLRILKTSGDLYEQIKFSKQK